MGFNFSDDDLILGARTDDRIEQLERNQEIIVEQYIADMKAIRHELETIWEAINELQGIDPERAGEPDGH